MSSADKSSTVVRQRTSNSRMVFLSTRPSRCMPRTPSCTAFATSLRYLRFVAIVQLRQLLPGEHLADAAGIERQQQRSVIFQVSLVVPTEVRLIFWRSRTGTPRDRRRDKQSRYEIRRVCLRPAATPAA